MHGSIGRIVPLLLLGLAVWAPSDSLGASSEVRALKGFRESGNSKTVQTSSNHSIHDDQANDPVLPGLLLSRLLELRSSVGSDAEQVESMLAEGRLQHWTPRFRARRRLAISNQVCEEVCKVSQRVVGKVILAGKVETRFCNGQEHLAHCCKCIEQGFALVDDGGLFATQQLTKRELKPGPRPAFLHICIPTTPRVLEGHPVDFLGIVLEALVEQVHEQAHSVLGFAGVNILVYNTRPGEHAAFETLRERFAKHDFIVFRENTAIFHDPTNFEPDNLNNPRNIPGSEVRRQVRPTCMENRGFMRVLLLKRRLLLFAI